jgi:hypothetical protein
MDNEGVYSSSVVIAVRSPKAAERLLAKGVSIGGSLKKATRFERSGPDVLCLRCCEWGHAAHQCDSAPKCRLCAGSHQEEEHKCIVEGCKARKGRSCIHMVRKCANCDGKHEASSHKCPHKSRAISDAKGRSREKAEVPEPEQGLALEDIPVERADEAMLDIEGDKPSGDSEPENDKAAC